MDQQVTLVHPGAPSHTDLAASSGLPRDLLEQMRGRIRLLTLPMLVVAVAWTQERAEGWWTEHQPARTV